LESLSEGSQPIFFQGNFRKGRYNLRWINNENPWLSFQNIENAELKDIKKLFTPFISTYQREK
jgi:hypothetical protein